jgi:hypothetical protein
LKIPAFIEFTTTYHLYHAFTDANRLLVVSLDIAKIRLEDGALRLVKPGGAPVYPSIPMPFWSILAAVAILPLSAFFFLTPVLFGWMLGIGMIPGLIGIIASGSLLANLALRMNAYASPTEVVEINSTVVTDESVPEDFQKK